MRFVLAILAASLFFTEAFAQSPAASEQVVPTDASFGIKLGWFDGAKCPAPDKTRFYFRVGKQIFAAPVAEFLGGQLRSIKEAKPSPEGGMKATVSRTAGCKSDPLPLVNAGLKTGAVNPEVVQITETPEPSGPEPLVTRYIKHLQQTGGCATTRVPNILVCAGSRTAGSQKVNIAFFVVTETEKLAIAPSGIPIHARCEGDEKTMACFVSDDIETGATVKAFVNLKGNAAAEDIRRFRQSILDFAAKRRVR